MADDAPAWTATIVARWTAPGLDWGFVAAASAVCITMASIAVSVWGSRAGWGAALPGAFALWALWEAGSSIARSRATSELMLTLDPERLTLASSRPGSDTVVLERGLAGWLAADETTDWHVRGLWLTRDDEASKDVKVAWFLAAMARVEVRSPGIPAARDLPHELPVAVLVGAWWPHPARRMTRTGTARIRWRWRDPDIAGFPRRERRERIVWSVIYLALAAMLLWTSVAPATRDVLRIPVAIAAIALVLWRVRVHSWRPTFVSAG
jgi:hypothetical protein